MLKRILFVISFIAVSFAAAAQQVSVNAEIDSCQRLIGEQARIKLKVGVDAGKRALLPLFDKEIVEGVEIVPIKGKHSRFEVTGFRIGRFAYLTDFKEIADEEVAKLKGVEVLVVNALRFEPHDSHFSVDDALDLIEKVAPKKSYLTHMSHDIGLHCVANLRLPDGVEFAYDGLKIEI